MNRGETFHVRWRGQVTGPHSWADLERKLDAHEIGLLHDLQFNNEWITLGELLARRGEARRIAPNAHAAAPTSAADFKTGPAIPLPHANAHSGRRRWVYIGLGLAGGYLALHAFYAGHVRRGAALLAASVALWLLGWGIFLPWLWAVGEVMIVKFDGQGRRMPWKMRAPKT